MAQKTLFWFRQDLRVTDNPGLYAAAQAGTVIPIYIYDQNSPGDFTLGGASRWWLHHSLSRLSESLNNQLNIYQGHAPTIILKLVKELEIDAVYWNQCYEPWHIKNDTDVYTLLIQDGIPCQFFNSSLLWEPTEIHKKDNTPYKRFTPFYNTCLNNKSSHKLSSKPKKLNFIKDQKFSITIQDLNLLPKIKWYSTIEKIWHPGELGAHKKLNSFLKNNLHHYHKNRDFPTLNTTSHLSPYLHWGEISPRQILHALQIQNTKKHGMTADIECFIRELTWREFSYHLLYHFPEIPQKNFQEQFDDFPWKNNRTQLESWKLGKTGYPFVDAGMRELWQTGYMHNRVRMIAASFLVKNLLIHWHHGAKWFWDCLVDADLANNSVNWQWVAGSGTDAAPYFRIFNPITQGKKFDPDGSYVRHFVPELKQLPNKYLFSPWTAPKSVLQKAGIILGETYPIPMIDLESSRQRALDAFASIQYEEE